MPQVSANGLNFEYDEHGNAGDPPMLLIMGLGAQMTLWPMEFVEALAGRGFRVIRYDNRDIGLSDKLHGEKVPGIAWHVIRKRLGFPPKVPYTLSDMAADGVGVLDGLGIDKAHVVGGSMGGMVSWTVSSVNRSTSSNGYGPAIWRAARPNRSVSAASMPPHRSIR